MLLPWMYGKEKCKRNPPGVEIHWYSILIYCISNNWPVVLFGFPVCPPSPRPFQLLLLSPLAGHVPLAECAVREGSATCFKQTSGDPAFERPILPHNLFSTFATNTLLCAKLPVYLFPRDICQFHFHDVFFKLNFLLPQPAAPWKYPFLPKLHTSKKRISTFILYRSSKSKFLTITL